MTADHNQVPVGNNRSRLGLSFQQISSLPLWVIVVAVAGLALSILIGLDGQLREAFVFIIGQGNGIAFRGIFVTLVVTMSAFGIAIVLGLIFGLMRSSRNYILNNIASLYVEVLRGLPLLVFLLYVSFVATPLIISGINAISGVIGLGDIISTRDVPLILRVIIALGLLYSAFSAEIFRAGIQSIERGQTEAARALGMRYRHIMLSVVLPQAMRRILPPIGNEFVAMVKDSALVAVLGVQDLTQLTRLYYSANFLFLQSLTVLAFIYLSVILTLSRLIGLMEKKLAIPDK